MRSPFVTQVRTPVDEQLDRRLFYQRLHHVLASIQGLAVRRVQKVCFFFAHHAISNETLCIQRSRSFLLTNLRIHLWLSACRFVCLVVPATTVANQIDYHVFFKLIT